jgi:hypothetical protein
MKGLSEMMKRIVLMIAGLSVSVSALARVNRKKNLQISWCLV